jgi:L-ascorbate metabolism protein UlaG (beta-lactamase superfamily)
MSIELTWFGHATWRIRGGGKAIVVDPFVGDNPSCPTDLRGIGPVDLILITHGHADHISDAAELARQTNAAVAAVFEIATWLNAKHRVANVLGMNLGGQTNFGFCQVKMTIAFHSSELPDGTYGGNPAGFVVTLGDQRIYIAGDTALFGDMQRIGEMRLDAAILPIGDLFTMGPADSLEAIKLLRPKFVLPSHYNTWPPIAQDAGAWAEQVRRHTPAIPLVLQPGQSHAI